MYNNSNSKKKTIKMSTEGKAKDHTNGRWSKEEHQKFLQGFSSPYSGLEIFGKNWKKI